MEHVDTSPERLADIRLLPGEKILRIITHEPRHGLARTSSLEQLMRLTSAQRSNDIGKFGPSIASLASESGDQPIPENLRLYEVVFGRDSLRVAADLLPNYPELARSTTLELAKLQGTTYDREREEESGRILHEARDEDDPIACALTEELGWQWPYYGSVDATPQFIRTLAGYCNLSEENRGFLFQHYQNKNNESCIMADALSNAVNWIVRHLDDNDEGLLEFKSTIPEGIENQVWKDSWDSYHHSDGQLVNHDRGVASIEVQVMSFDALHDAADLYEQVLNRAPEASALRERANRLKEAILHIFWTDEKGGYFVLGTDRDSDNNLRQIKIRTSNMGHVLNSRLLETDEPDIVEKREATMKQLTSSTLLTTKGIRTLANDEVRFRPGSYHNGSVWLWDTHYIASGMRRLHYNQEADELDRRVLQAVEDTRSFPEYVRGDDTSSAQLNQRTVDVWDDVNQRINRVEQPPQEVQAWTVSAVFAIKKQLDRKY